LTMEQLLPFSFARRALLTFAR